MGFLTQLDRASHPIVQKLICQHIVSGNVKSLLKQVCSFLIFGLFNIKDELPYFWVLGFLQNVVLIIKVNCSKKIISVRQCFSFENFH